eukprot:1939431-Rhodomonas_salina.1
MLLCDARYEHSVSGAMRGTEIAHAGQEGGMTRLLRSPISLRPCYAMSGTDLAYGAISLRPCYAMSLPAPYALPTPCPVLTGRMRPQWVARGPPSGRDPNLGRPYLPETGPGLAHLYWDGQGPLYWDGVVGLLVLVCTDGSAAVCTGTRSEVCTDGAAVVGTDGTAVAVPGP